MHVKQTPFATQLIGKIALKIYQSCLSAFLLLQAKVDSPSFVVNEPSSTLYILVDNAKVWSLKSEQREEEQDHKTCTNLKKPPPPYGGGGLNWCFIQLSKRVPSSE